MAPLYEIFKVNSRLYMNCLDAMDNDKAGWRPNDKTNSAAYIALHLVDTRHWIANMLGLALTHPFKEACEKAKSIADFTGFPALDELRDAWKAVTGEVREALKNMTAAQLDAPAKWNPPGVDDKSTLGMMAFLMQHDSYHIGQLALLRKQLGLDAMSYK